MRVGSRWEALVRTAQRGRPPHARLLQGAAVSPGAIPCSGAAWKARARPRAQLPDQATRPAASGSAAALPAAAARCWAPLLGPSSSLTDSAERFHCSQSLRTAVGRLMSLRCSRVTNKVLQSALVPPKTCNVPRQDISDEVTLAAGRLYHDGEYISQQHLSEMLLIVADCSETTLSGVTGCPVKWTRPCVPESVVRSIGSQTWARKCRP